MESIYMMEENIMNIHMYKASNMNVCTAELLQP